MIGICVERKIQMRLKNVLAFATTHPTIGSTGVFFAHFESGLAVGAMGDVHQRVAVMSIQPSS
jgi:hypothetical protein